MARPLTGEALASACDPGQTLTRAGRESDPSARMLLQAVAPPALSASAWDRQGVNIIALIGHGSAADLEKLSADAAAAGFIAKHADGPQGDEVMVLFKSTDQAAAWPFVLRAEEGRYPRLRFERALLPPKPAQ